MQKIRLDLDALRVESFAIHPALAARGTVRAQETDVSEATCVEEVVPPIIVIECFVTIPPVCGSELYYDTCELYCVQLDTACESCYGTCDGSLECAAVA